MSCKAALQRLFCEKGYTNNLELNWIELIAYGSIFFLIIGHVGLYTVHKK